MKYTFILVTSLFLYNCGTLQAQTDAIEINEATTEDDNFPEPSSGIGGGQPSSADEVFTYVEEEPKFQGNLDLYFLEHYEVTEVIAYKGRSGTLALMFTVEKDGGLSNIKVIPGKGLSPLQDAEAIRVLNTTSGKWFPGRNNGAPVKTYYKYLLRFAETEDGEIALAKKEITKPDFSIEARFNEGDFNEYIRQHYVVSKEIRKEGVVGTVTITIPVEADGSVKKVTVDKSMVLDQYRELVRVVETTSGMWTPGTLNGIPVRTEIKITYTFTEKELRNKQKKK